MTTPATAMGDDPGQKKPQLAPKLLNRSHATRRLDEEMVRASQQADYRFSVLLVAFEGLSETADRLGYAAEEDGWRRALGFLVPELTGHDLCSRLSGEEFLLILSERDHVAACDARQRLRERWQPAPGSREADLRVFIGIASYPTHGPTIERLLCAADEALHADRLQTNVPAVDDDDHGHVARARPLGRLRARLSWRGAQVA